MATPIEKVQAALEAPTDMVDADLMFCLQDYQHLPYETVKAIALSVCKVIAARNREALSELKGKVLVPAWLFNDAELWAAYQDEVTMQSFVEYRARRIAPYVNGGAE